MPSIYTPQLPHWSQDLSKWNNSASIMQALNSDSDKLKHNETLLFVNDDYCEISRRRPNARYHHLLFQVLTGLMALSVLSFVIFFCVPQISEKLLRATPIQIARGEVSQYWHSLPLSHYSLLALPPLTTSCSPPKIIHYVSTVKQVRFTSMITLTCTSGIWRKLSPRYLNSLFSPYTPNRKSF